MRTRAAILSMLALGFLLSTTGAGLAVGGLAGSDQASQAQYPPPPAEPTPQAPPAPAPVAPAAPAPQSDEIPAEEKPPAPRNEVLPDQSEVLPEEIQPSRQAEVGAQAVPAEDAETLPFTGFAALPVLLLGLALLSAGLVMRRSAGKD